jgi:hypothetical protein
MLGVFFPFLTFHSKCGLWLSYAAVHKKCGEQRWGNEENKRKPVFSGVL